MHDDFYQMYLEELKEIPPCGAAELSELLAAYSKDNAGVKKRLVEGHLKRSLEYAKEYADRGVSLGDLAQEAGVALTAAVENWNGEEFAGYIEREIRGGLLRAVEDQAAQKRTGEEVAARVNVLQEVSRVMAGELGREATVEELADRMKMTAEEIKAIMKMTIDALSVGGEA